MSKVVVELPYDVGETVAAVFCIGPNWTDVLVEEGTVESLTLSKNQGMEEISVKIRFGNTSCCYYSIRGKSVSLRVYSSVEEAITDLEKIGYNIKEIRRK